MVITVADDSCTVRREYRRPGPVPAWFLSALLRLLDAADTINAAASRNEPAKLLLNVRGESVKAEVTRYIGE